MSAESMKLPDGFTCQDCYAFKRFCKPVIGIKPESVKCDYFPVRFMPSLEMVNKLKEAAKV